MVLDVHDAKSLQSFFLKNKRANFFDGGIKIYRSLESSHLTVAVWKWIDFDTQKAAVSILVYFYPQE